MESWSALRGSHEDVRLVAQFGAKCCFQFQCGAQKATGNRLAWRSFCAGLGFLADRRSEQTNSI